MPNLLRYTLSSLVVLSVLALPSDCGAWGAQGHRIIGQIAWHYLTPEAKAGVTDLLGEQSLGQAGCWADEIRSDHAYDWAKPLHYVNVAKDAEAVDTARDCPNGECVVGAIRRYRDIVANTSAPREKRSEALKFLIHFVGDIHQPLHVSYAEDRGGNRLSLTFMGKRSNFHKVWDTDIIEQKLAAGDWIIWGDELQASITTDQTTLYGSSNDPLAWANETLTITRQLYRNLDSDELDVAYFEANLPVVEDQLGRAGVRLAAMLNAMFAPPAASQPGTQPASSASGGS